ncbi:MAG: hypothetical protein MJZ06_05340 [Bacteroidaceae bacterium]|nr:hypothetical protein [Bacteroidaceae bacterium]
MKEFKLQLDKEINFPTKTTVLGGKGPYISLKTPFVKAAPGEIDRFALAIKPNFASHRHQLKSF